MNIEKNTACIARFMIGNAGEEVNPYYENIPEGFAFPALYFPAAQVIQSGDTLNSYALKHSMYAVAFGETTEKAHAIAMSIVKAFGYYKNTIPEYDTDGKPDGGYLRIADIRIKTIDDGAVQMTVEWTTREAYIDRMDGESIEKIRTEIGEDF